MTPNSAIYFYQFSSQKDPVYTTWSMRFLIAAADGSSTHPTNVSDAGTPYGFGYFVDPTLYNAPPSYMIGNGQIIGSNNNASVSGSFPSSTETSTGSASIHGGKPSGTTSSTATTSGKSGHAVSLTDAASWFVVTLAALFGATVVGI